MPAQPCLPRRSPARAKLASLFYSMARAQQSMPNLDRTHSCLFWTMYSCIGQSQQRSEAAPGGSNSRAIAGLAYMASWSAFKPRTSAVLPMGGYEDKETSHSVVDEPSEGTSAIRQLHRVWRRRHIAWCRLCSRFQNPPSNVSSTQLS
eukprot:75144-Pleurochrysis_carterae.AAC.3